MPTLHQWKHGWADAYAARNDKIADEFLDLVVRPSMAALNRKHQEYVSSVDPVLYGFSATDQLDLINKTAMAFCLSIQSLWERQIRGYLAHCVSSVPIAGVSSQSLERAEWGEAFEALFLQVRGIDLRSFDSYRMLSLLHLLANGCRHGDGSSSRRLFKLHPHLWPEWARTGITPAFQHVQIAEELLVGFINAIALFWMDMERLGLETLSGNKPIDRIALLGRHRQGRLDSFTHFLA